MSVVKTFAREHHCALIAQNVLGDAVPFWRSLGFVESLSVPDNMIVDGYQLLLVGEAYHFDTEEFCERFA